MVIKSLIFRLNHGIDQGRGDIFEQGPVQPPLKWVRPQFIEWIPMTVHEDRIRFAIGNAHLIIGRQGMGDAAKGKKTNHENEAANSHR
jgi:hypothetical protein